MTAPHFFVEEQAPPAPGQRIHLSEGDSVHALRSRRLRPGEAVTLSDGASWQGRGVLAGQDAGLAVIEVEEISAIVSPRVPEVDVSMAPPKGERLAWATQKLSELGVRELEVMATERSIRRPGPGAMARLAVIGREAAMQSSQPTVMRVGHRDGLPPPPHKEVLGILLHESAAQRLHAVLPEQAEQIHLLIGPEGGFSDQEISLGGERGFRAASLGSSILRTETAAVVGAALVLARYGRLG